MKVALVHDYLNQHGGAERVLEALIEMYPEAPIFTLIADIETLKEPIKSRTIHNSFLAKFPFVKKHYKKYLLLYPTAIEQFDLSSYELVISSSSAFAKGVITKPGTAHICYCHTPMRYSWDLYHSYLREDGPSGIYKKILPFAMNYIRMWDVITASRVDHFIANSEYVSKRIKKYYRRDSNVVYPPTNIDRFYLSSVDQVESYFLVVSRLLPYKRIDIIIEACNDLNLPLVVIGDGYDRARLERIAGANVKFLGFQKDEVIAEYYSKCQAFIFAGDEDFGLTPVEAQASGRPVIAFRRGGALETVVENVTGVFFNNQTKESLIEVLQDFNVKMFNPEEIRMHTYKFGKQQFFDGMNCIIREEMTSR